MSSDILIRPEQLRATAQSLSDCARKIKSSLSEVDRIISGLSRGPFEGQRSSQLLARYKSQREAIFNAPPIVTSFAELLVQSADRFEAADKQLQSNSSPFSLIGQGVVLGASTEAQLESNIQDKPNFMDWAKGVYDIIEKIAGKVVAGTILSKILSSGSAIKDGTDLVIDSQAVTDANRNYYAAIDQYGVHSPQALQARAEYSSSELNQIIPGLIVTVLKQTGAWEKTVGCFEEIKYGPGLIPKVE